MMITKCDSCGEEIPAKNAVFILQLWNWESPSTMLRCELCEDCAQLIAKLKKQTKEKNNT